MVNKQRVRILLPLLLLAGYVWADEFDLPETTCSWLPETAASAALFVPEGWRLESESKGDLNQDNRDDLLLILKEDNPANIMTDDPDSSWARSWDENPRVLVVAFALLDGGYELVFYNAEFLPSQTDPSFADPLGGAYIMDGAIRINLGSFANAGTWLASSWNFTFRYLDQAFRLVAYSTATVHRATGAFIGIAEDYLARTSTITKADGADDTITTERLPARDSLLTLEEVCAGGVSMDPLYPADDEYE